MMGTTPVLPPALPLPLLRRGKVREVYELDDRHLLIVTSDRVSAFDVVMREPVPGKGAVLTQLSAYWFRRLAEVCPSHFVTADIDQIVERHSSLRRERDGLAGRTMLVRRAEPVRFECVVRGYLAGSAWAEYHDHGTLAGESLPGGLVEGARLDPPLFSPATKAEAGHDLNVPFEQMVGELGEARAVTLRTTSLAVYRAGVAAAAMAGIIIADTKFEFGVDPDGRLVLIDEVLTPDSSRFWPMAGYRPGGPQPSFDKQPLRDYLAGLRADDLWNGQAPPPPLPSQVIDAMARRYRDIFQRLTGRPLEVGG